MLYGYNCCHSLVFNFFRGGFVLMIFFAIIHSTRYSNHMVKIYTMYYHLYITTSSVESNLINRFELDAQIEVQQQQQQQQQRGQL